MSRVFMYGPDAKQGRMFDRIGPTEVVGAAIAEGFELVFDKPNMKAKAEGLANLRSAEGERVFGVVFELTRKQSEDLGGYFGGYEAKSIRVKLQTDPEREGHTEEVTTFVARRRKSDLRPSRSTLDLTRKALVENGADPSFLRALSKFEALDD